MLRIWQPGDERPYFHRVDALRGLGCFAVAAFHIGGWNLGQRPLLPEGWVYWIPGHAALMMFFVVSGFVLRLALEHAANSRGLAARFLVGRVFRIYPIALVALAVAALLPMCRVGIAAMELPHYGPANWLAAALLIDVAFNDTLWALQVELLAAPVILALFLMERRFGIRWLILATTAFTMLAFVPGWTISRPLSNTLFAFPLGMLVPTLGRRIVYAMNPAAATVSTLAATIVLLFCGPALGTYSIFSKVIEAYAAAWLVSVIVYRTELAAFRWLDVKPLAWIGQAAGSYYVMHMATIPLFLPFAAMVLPQRAWAGPAAIVLWLALLVPLARAGFVLVERPGMNLGRRFGRWLTQQQVTRNTEAKQEVRRAA